MNGMNSLIQSALYTEIKKTFYNSSQSGNYFTHVLVFAADGTIPSCSLNFSGSTHDSTLADSGFIYDKLEKVYQETGLKYTFDLVFRCKNTPYLSKSIQDNLYAQCLGLNRERNQKL